MTEEQLCRLEDLTPAKTGQDVWIRARVHTSRYGPLITRRKNDGLREQLGSVARVQWLGFSGLGSAAGFVGAVRTTTPRSWRKHLKRSSSASLGAFVLSSQFLKPTLKMRVSRYGAQGASLTPRLPDT